MVNTVLAVIGAVSTALLAFGIGTNDSANSFGTSVGSGALKIRNAYILGYIFEALGAAFVGASVSKQVSEGVIDKTHYQSNINEFTLGILGTIVGATLWLFLSCKFSLPVSTTHSIYGGLVGFGLYFDKGVSIKWAKLKNVGIAWIISPIAGFFISFMLSLFINYMITRSDNLQESRKYLHIVTPFYISITSAVIGVFILDSIIKTILGYSLETSVMFGILAGIFLLSLISCYFLLKYYFIPQQMKNDLDEQETETSDLELELDESIEYDNNFYFTMIRSKEKQKRLCLQAEKSNMLKHSTTLELEHTRKDTPLVDVDTKNSFLSENGAQSPEDMNVNNKLNLFPTEELEVLDLIPKEEMLFPDLREVETLPETFIEMKIAIKNDLSKLKKKNKSFVEIPKNQNQTIYGNFNLLKTNTIMFNDYNMATETVLELQYPYKFDHTNFIKDDYIVKNVTQPKYIEKLGNESYLNTHFTQFSINIDTEKHKKALSNVFAASKPQENTKGSVDESNFAKKFHIKDDNEFNPHYTTNYPEAGDWIYIPEQPENRNFFDDGNLLTDTESDDEIPQKQKKTLNDILRNELRIIGVFKKLFFSLQAITSCLISFGHGANGLAAAVGPFTMVIDQTLQPPGSKTSISNKRLLGGITLNHIILVTAALFLGAGLSIFGKRVLMTVGTKITLLTPIGGFCAQFSTGLVLLISARASFPVSSTSVLVGSIFGIGVAALGFRRGVNVRVILKIIGSWIITLPISGITAIIFFSVFRPSTWKTWTGNEITASA